MRNRERYKAKEITFWYVSVAALRNNSEADNIRAGAQVGNYRQKKETSGSGGGRPGALAKSTKQSLFVSPSPMPGVSPEANTP